MRKAIIFIVVAFLLVLGATPVYANGISPQPHAFCGTVEINGSPAPTGTTIEARGRGVITGVEGNPITTTEEGKYGRPEPLGTKLIVKGDIVSGTEISFLVNGIYTGTTFDFKSGETTELDLALVITDESITDEVEETIPSGQTVYVVDASDIADTTITVGTLTGLGVVTITVKKYYSNPHPEVTPPADMVPKYCDIEVDNPDAVAWPMYVEQTYTDAEVAGLVESSLGMYYYKAGAWHRCSATDVNTGANYVWANMTKDELSGSPVAIGGTAAAPPGGGGGGGGAPTYYYTETNLFGIEKSYRISRTGEMQKTIEATSTDGMLTITIPKDTVAKNKDGNRLSSLTSDVDETPPDPPEDAYIIGLAYDFGPDGATFDPPITLEYTYDPADIPEGVAEEDLVTAYYNEDAGEWVELDCVLDTENNTITASVEHFTTFAIIGSPTPAAFTVSSLSISPMEVNVGETVTISLLVTNAGGISGSYTVTLKINGVKEADKSVTIAAGGSQTVSFSVTKEEAGTYSVEVDGLTGSFTVVAPVPPLPIAVVSVTSLSIEPTQVEPGEAVTVSLVVANTGGKSGSYTVTLKINGVKEADKSVTIAAGKSQDVSFSVTKEKAGSYTVDVDGLSGSFAVAAPVTMLPPAPAKPAINWPLVGGIIAGVVVVGLLIFFLVRRRAY